jgi:superfamily II DNA or RNA helicase
MVKLRNYQKPAVEHCLNMLEERGNSLLVASTGSGKTYMFAYISGMALKNGLRGKKDLKCLFLVHRDEINEQNRNAFRNMHPTIQTSVFKGGLKFCTRATFGMVQTVAKVYDKLPRFDIIVGDEFHRGLAQSYMNIINQQKKLAEEEGKPLYLLGVTATPSRSDEQSLFTLFDNFYQISMKELIETKALVKPVFLDMTPETDTDNGITGISDGEYANLVIEAIHKALSVGRKKIIVFCPNHKRIGEIKNYLKEVEPKVSLSFLEESMSDSARKEEIIRFARDENEKSILFNVDICTEGFDYQPTDCVILARRIGEKTKGLFIQMVGRAMRGIDPTRFKCQKKDAFIIDLGGNIQRFGDLTPVITKESKKKGLNEKGLTLQDILGEDYESVVGYAKENKEEKEKIGRIVGKSEILKELYAEDNPFIETVETPDGEIARVAYHKKVGFVEYKGTIYTTKDSKNWKEVKESDETTIKDVWEFLKISFPSERDKRPVSNVMYSLIGTDYSLVGLDWYRGECIIALKSFFTFFYKKDKKVLTKTNESAKLDS